MKASTIVLLSVLVMSAGLFLLSDASDAETSSNPYGGGDFLVDYGNGDTKWVVTHEGATIEAAIKATLDAASIEHNSDLSSIAGRSARTLGLTTGSGSVSTPGTTGLTTTTSWIFYSWDGTEWQPIVDLSAAYTGQKLAAGYYPAGIVPVETPEYKSSWTQHQGDAASSSTQTAVIDEQKGQIWKHIPTYGGEEPSCVYGGSLVARDNLIVKYGSAAKTSMETAVICYDISNGDERWRFSFNPSSMDTTGPVIVGQYLYVTSNNGHIYRLDWRVGPGVDNVNVITLGGAAWDDDTAKIPNVTVDIDWYVSYVSSLTTPVADSGGIFCKAYNGMTYCFDLNLNLIWSYQMEGHCYYSTATVMDGYVFAGCYDGRLYVLNQNDGSFVCSYVLFQTVTQKGKCGAANVPIVVPNGSGYTVFITYTDGLGMDSVTSGFTILNFDGTSLSLQREFKNSLGSCGTFLTRYKTADFNGVIINTDRGMYAVDCTGNARIITDAIKGYDSPHSSAILVNEEILYLVSYSSKKAFTVTLDGTVTGELTGISTFAMTSPVIVDGYVVISDDNGIQIYHTAYNAPVPPAPVKVTPLWQPLVKLIICIIAAIAIIWAVMRFVLGWKHPFSDLKEKIMHYFFGENYSHNTKSKRKVRVVLLIGILITVAVGLASLCIGSDATLSLREALSTTASAISKGGRNLTYHEMLIYNQRLPRVLAAVGVGIGLSVAGAMYQAIIKNPLVEPYIMGVSSGAGTFAVAVITFDFTFFGLFAAQSPYLTAVSAIVGGLVAFGLTMLLALKTGGKSVNYVLAGIVIGLVFSAIQSVMMIEAGTRVASALSWLYGSFSTMNWDKLWLVLIPSLTLSFIPLIWAKEFNLVLLGEDQARQMGLDAKRFDNIMLIIASVLTAFCVAFCGIIGFVGLVIPHLSRMLLGGDHRLMLPATMAFGGFLMVSADLLARILLTGYELPVGAITTIIGVPVFAYLLIKRGRGYDG